jgi:hypothetical protein
MKLSSSSGQARPARYTGATAAAPPGDMGGTVPLAGTDETSPAATETTAVRRRGDQDRARSHAGFGPGLVDRAAPDEDACLLALSP